MAVLENAALAALVFAVLYVISRALEWCGGKARDTQMPADAKILPSGRVKPASFGAHYRRA